MNYRNAKQIGGTRIDCEIDHPIYGWVPFTCDPEDTGAGVDVITLYDAMAADPSTLPHVPPSQEDIDAAALAAARSSMTLSFAQLLIGLVTEGWISEADGEAWLIGTLPAPVLALIASLPTAQQFAAKARAIRPSEVLRQDTLVVALGSYTGKTEAEIDTFFRTYAQA
jgi:hypothetical protein